MSRVRAVGGNFNPAKSVHMRFCKAEPPSSSPDHFMDGVLVPQSCAHRHLGVMLDSRLSYSAHIEGVTSRFRQRVVLLSYMAKYLSPDIVDKLYKGYVRPVVEYSSPLWHSRLTAHQSLTLERLQVRVGRQLLARLLKILWIFDFFLKCLSSILRNLRAMSVLMFFEDEPDQRREEDRKDCNCRNK